MSGQQFELDHNKGYFEAEGVNVMAFDDYYPDGHQSGISIIMHGSRVATNGDLRFEPTPGQWQPVPVKRDRTVNASQRCITTSLSYPDRSRHLSGYNPSLYPDIDFSYRVRAMAVDNGIEVHVDLERPLPDQFAGRLFFNLELFPGELFDQPWIMTDGPRQSQGIFPRQANGPLLIRQSSYSPALAGPEDISPADNQAQERWLRGEGAYQPAVADTILAEPYARGHELTINPVDPLRRLTISSPTVPLALYDGRLNHNNGWFAVSSEIPLGRSTDALVWTIRPQVVSGWRSRPVVQVSQVGYLPRQPKVAVVELDSHLSQAELTGQSARLLKITQDGPVLLRELTPQLWGKFLRYSYVRFDFSDLQESGLYRIDYAGAQSSLFQVAADVYDRGVWQPVLEYFLPVQMCHMSVREKYRIWHDLCHHTDALMAPTDHNHFDGYAQGPSTLCAYSPGQLVPGLDRGGWHDAGDSDLRVESQAGEVYSLSLAVEEFQAFLDSTSIDQATQIVEIHQPDGRNDFLEQIEHGLLSLVGSYEAMGRLYRGIVASDLREYALLGDAASSFLPPAVVPASDQPSRQAAEQVDSQAGVGLGSEKAGQAAQAGPRQEPAEQSSQTADFPLTGSSTRWVFTEDNARRELAVAAELAAAVRAMRGFNDQLGERALRIARQLFERTDASQVSQANALDGSANQSDAQMEKIWAATELYLTTGEAAYSDYVSAQIDFVLTRLRDLAPIICRIETNLTEPFQQAFRTALPTLAAELEQASAQTPYGVPYVPQIWGAGWEIQNRARDYYFLHRTHPDIFSPDLLFNSLNFVLGTHPGSNSASFVSGVGTDSVTVGYGFNRADWSYIPGGVVSGTALIRPDFPELLRFPYLWQQVEYVLGGGSSNFLFMVLAVKRVLEQAG